MNRFFIYSIRTARRQDSSRELGHKNLFVVSYRHKQDESTPIMYPCMNPLNFVFAFF